VTGVDLSQPLIEIARQRSDASNVTFRVDDAQTLTSFADRSVDVVVSQMAIMDVADHRSMFKATRRVLNARGVFAFSLLHPCFESPYRPPDEPQFLVDDDGTRVGCVVRRYATEGYWRAEGAGVRGHVGSHHRMLSTYINDLVSSGFRIERIVEPVFDVPGVGSQVPRVMMVVADVD
jgi:SAM-dependent methyltransferase